MAPRCARSPSCCSRSSSRRSTRSSCCCSFWLPRVPRYRHRATGAAINLWGARWICGIRSRVDRRARTFRRRRTSSCPSTARRGRRWRSPATSRRSRTSPRRSCCRSRSSAGASRSPRRSRSTARPGSDAMEQIVEQGRERFAQGFWIVIYPEGTRIRVGTRVALQDRRRAARDRRCSVPILPVAHNAGYLWPKGALRQAAGNRHDVDRQADRTGGQGRRRQLMRGSRDVDRRRGRAARRRRVTRDAPRSRDRQLDPAHRDRDTRDGQLRRIVLAGQRDRLPAVRARRRSIGMEVASRRPHRARAALGDAARDRGRARRARAWIVRSLAEWRARRRDVMPREWKSGAPILYRGRELALAIHPARRTSIAADLFHLTVRHPHAHDERAGRRVRRPTG